MQNSVCFEGR